MGRTVDTGRQLLVTLRRAELGFLAAALAYYAFVAAVPLVLVAVAVASAVGGEAFADAVVDAVRGVLSADAAAVLDASLTSGAGREGATVLGLVALGWSGLKLFRGLETAFTRVYGQPVGRSLPERVGTAAVALGALALGVGGTVLFAGVLPFGRLPLVGVAGTVLTAGVLSAVFVPVFWILPARSLSLRSVLPGAAVAGAGWATLGVAFGVYTRLAGGFQLYGVLAGVVLLLTWLYLGALLVLLGAVVNTTLADARPDRQLQHGSHRLSAHRQTMSEDEGEAPSESTDDAGPAADGEPVDAGGPADVSPMDVETADPEEVERLRRQLERFEEEIEDRTVHRDELEGDLRRYVRRKLRRGHARGWGPYLVLLYGTAMTLGAFFYLEGIWAILAMFVVWLSTLGMYVVMLVVGWLGLAVGVPGRLLDRVREFRE